MLINEREFHLFTDNPVEYVRMQVDNSNPFSAKVLIKQLVRTICNIKPTKNCPVSPYLENYLTVLADNFASHNG
jgi:hypothetical protein